MAKTVVCGPSCAGKSTYVWASRADEDLTVDYDRIAAALGCSSPHGAEDDIKFAAYRARYAAIRVALTSEHSPWIIHSSPDEEQIAEYMDSGFEFVVVDPGLDACLGRCETDDRPDGTEQRIRDWYENPPTFPDDATVTTINPESENRMSRRQAKQTQNRGGRIVLPTNEADDGAPSIAEVFIYDEIGYWGTSAQDFAHEIANIEADELHVFINSPGGAAWDGIAIMNALRRHKATVNVTVDGIAASAASVIAMAGDHITMNRGSEMMIHEASGGAYGPAKVMEDTADILHKLSASIADIYAARAGGSTEEWRSRMVAETWYTAEEAVEAGLADEWIDAPAVENHFNLSVFNFAGRSFAPAPHNMLPAPEPVKEKKGNAMSIAEGVRDRLGLPEGTGDEDVLKALNERLNTTAQVEVPAGAVMIDEGILAELQADAAAGREALEAQAEERREGLIQVALKDGRISPAMADTWRSSLAENEERTKPLLEGLPKNTINVEEDGHQGELSTVDALYETAWPTDQKGK